MGVSLFKEHGHASPILVNNGHTMKISDVVVI